MSAETVADVLLVAAALVEDDGADLMGAIEVAAPNVILRERAVDELAAYLGVKSVVRWNNRPGRTVGDVAAALYRTAEHAPK